MPNDECLHVLLVLLEYLFRFAVDLFQRTEIHPLHLFNLDKHTPSHSALTKMKIVIYCFHFERPADTSKNNLSLFASANIITIG